MKLNNINKDLKKFSDESYTNFKNANYEKQLQKYQMTISIMVDFIVPKLPSIEHNA